MINNVRMDMETLISVYSCLHPQHRKPSGSESIQALKTSIRHCHVRKIHPEVRKFGSQPWPSKATRFDGEPPSFPRQWDTRVSRCLELAHFLEIQHVCCFKLSTFQYISPIPTEILTSWTQNHSKMCFKHFNNLPHWYMFPCPHG